jgi:hypothetical protein
MVTVPSRKEASMKMGVDLWNYGEDLERRSDLEGFGVAALDGDIGKIDDAAYDNGSSYIVVDTGPWIFGKRVLIPARAIVRVDVPNEKVFLRLKKAQIEDAPDLQDVQGSERDREVIGAYYEPIF